MKSYTNRKSLSRWKNTKGYKIIYATLNGETYKSKRSTRRKEQNKKCYETIWKTKKVHNWPKTLPNQNHSSSEAYKETEKKQARKYLSKLGKTVARLRKAGDSWHDEILWRRHRGRRRQYIHQGREHRWTQSGNREDVRPATQEKGQVGQGQE